MTHKDDKFRNADCPNCAEFKAIWENEYRLRLEAQVEVTRLTQELEKANDACVMYRGQIKASQQDQTWFQQRGSGGMK